MLKHVLLCSFAELEICPSVLYKLLNWQKRENVSSDTFMLIVFFPFVKDISFNRYLEQERMLTDRQQEVQYMFYS